MIFAGDTHVVLASKWYSWNNDYFCRATLINKAVGQETMPNTLSSSLSKDMRTSEQCTCWLGYACGRHINPVDIFSESARKEPMWILLPPVLVMSNNYFHLCGLPKTWAWFLQQRPDLVERIPR